MANQYLLLTRVLVAAATLASSCFSEASHAASVDNNILIGLRGERIPPTQAPAIGEGAACSAALCQYLSQSDPEQVSALTTYLSTHPNSPYRLGMLTSLGSIYFRTARFSQCLETFEAAWAIGRGNIDAKALPLAGKAAGELALMYARLGRYESLEALLKEVEGRVFGGSGTNLLDDARMGFGLMTSSPGTSFRCGPLALSRILANQGEASFFPPAIRDSVSTRQGFSLKQTCDIAHQAGMAGYRMARRSPGAPILTPAVVHWKVGHYAALLGRSASGRYRVEDPTFASQLPLSISAEALDQEASGYFLVEAAELPEGWSAVDDNEGAAVFGKGATGRPDPDGVHDNSPSVGPNSDDGNCKGMASWGVHTSVVSLNIKDTPLGYQPPVGYPVNLRWTYNSRENLEHVPQPITDTGGRWMRSTTAYLSYMPDIGVNVYPGTGARNYYKWNENTQSYLRDKRTYSTLERLGQNSFEVTYPDGTKERYEFVAWGWDPFSQEFFRTSLKDPAGNETRFQYERLGIQGFPGEYTRLTKIIDPIEGETLFQYAGNQLDPSRVTDPFGRFAEFEYDAEGHLTLIRDVMGIESRFRYQGVTDLMEALITPYGETTFAFGESGVTRWLQATHPNGDQERVEFRHHVDGIAATPGTVPVGILAASNFYDERNALYWDRKAMKEAPGDVNSAKITHFLHTPDTSISSDLIESTKSPLEGRVWFNYRGQTHEFIAPSGPDTRINKVARLLDDGSTQLYQMEHNDLGKLTKVVDPAGRTTTFVYDANQIDLLEVRQMTGTNTHDVLATFTYNAQHQPLTFHDSAGGSVAYTYNPRGQLLTVTNAKSEAIMFDYNANGYPTAIDGPLPGAVDRLTLTHDAFGRLHTMADASGLTMSYAYDALDRPTRQTYADGSADEWTYEAMNLKTFRSRGGDLATDTFNSLRQVTAIADRAGRTSVLEWCRCGNVSQLIDPLGQLTRFTYDVQGRLTGKVFADGHHMQVQYQPVSGRVAKVIDEDGREQQISYAPDNRIASVSSGGTAPAGVLSSFVWDPVYPRPVSFTDPGGTTTLGYHLTQSGQPGAGKLASMDGPLPNDTITIQYDELGRQASQSVGTGNTQTTTFDAMGRLTGVVNPLGTFGFGFDGSSTRVTSMLLPNGQSSQFTYLSANGLKLLSQIQHLQPGNVPLSSFAMARNDHLQVNSLTRSIGAGAPMLDTASYDAAGRLNSFQKGLPGGGSQAFSYAYDMGDNRLSETVDGAATNYSINAVNQIQAVEPPVGPARSYEWDAAGRLAAINIGTHRSEFTYDALSRRVRIVEKDNGSTTQDRRFVFAGFEPVEERDAAGTVLKRFMGQGFQSGGTSYYYTRDHLGSVHEVCDAAGSLVARYDYDPFGRRSQNQGALLSDIGFAGLFYHSPSGLVLTHARAYDPNLGRWISRDPAGEMFGLNLYAYVNNDPLSFVDLSGLNAGSPDYVGAIGNAVQAGGGIAGATVAVVATGAALTAGAPVVATTALVVGSGVVLYSSLNAVFNVVQAVRKLQGQESIKGLGGGEFQFNPVTEIAHGLCWGGDAHPFQEVGVLAAGIGFDMAMGAGFNAAAGGPKLAAALAKAAAATQRGMAAGEGLGHLGNFVNIAPAAAGVVPPISPTANLPKY